MCKDGLDARALGGIVLKDGDDEIVCLFRETVRDLKVTLKNLLLHDGLVIVIERQGSTQKRV